MFCLKKVDKGPFNIPSIQKKLNTLNVKFICKVKHNDAEIHNFNRDASYFYLATGDTICRFESNYGRQAFGDDFYSCGWIQIRYANGKPYVDCNFNVKRLYDIALKKVLGQ